MHASGTFEVKITPIPAEDGAPAFGRFSLDKKFSGDLEAESRGLMLSGGDPGKGIAGYVAMEVVMGKISGKEGTFMLQHNATMQNGEQALNVIVVPGSGTGGLAGISGRLDIRIEEGGHFYGFEWSIDTRNSQYEDKIIVRGILK